MVTMRISSSNHPAKKLKVLNLLKNNHFHLILIGCFFLLEIATDRAWHLCRAVL